MRRSQFQAMRSALRSVSLFISLALCAVGSVSAANWFEPCDRVAVRSKPFRHHWEDNEMPKGPCFLLNTKELIYVDEYGLMYQSLRTNDAAPTAITGRNPSIAREFVAINKKRYALVRDSNMRDGWESSGLALLYLVPPQTAGRHVGLAFEVAYLMTSVDSPDDCSDKRASVNCTERHSVRLLDGGSQWVDLSASVDFVRVGEPRLVGGEGAVSAIELDLFLPTERRSYRTIRYSLTSGSPAFRSDDLPEIAKALALRAPVKVQWQPNQSSQQSSGSDEPRN